MEKILSPESSGAPAASAASPPTSGPLFIVINAGSGVASAEERTQAIAKVLNDAGRAHQFFLITDPSTICDIAKQAVRLAQQQRGVVVASGGDGTINAVAQAVLGSGCAFGVLPTGTFNYFGRVHGIPQDCEAATLGLLTAHVHEVQAGLVNERIFLVNASVGLYPQLLEDRETFKHRFGRNRFVAMAAGLITLVRNRRQLRLTIESSAGSALVRTPTLFVGNNRLQFEQVGLEDAHRVAVDHGGLAAIVVRPIGALAMLYLALRGALGSLGSAENVRSFAFKRITVMPYRTSRIKVATDGEVNWMRTPLTFQVAAQPLHLLVPPVELQADVA